MEYLEIVKFLRDYVLVSHLMATVVSVLMALTLTAALRTKAWGLLILFGGQVPLFVYYLFSAFHLWSTSIEGHVYGRLAYLVFFVTLIVAIRRWEQYANARGISPGTWEYYTFLAPHVERVKSIIRRDEKHE